MIYIMSSSIELRITSYGTNKEIYNALIYIEGMIECYYAKDVYNIMII